MVTEERLSPKQVIALECLVARLPSESMEDVANRAGVTRMSLYRYLKDPKFYKEYCNRVALELGTSRGRMANALVTGGLLPGPGQAAMQKLYWQMLGEVREALEINNLNSGGSAKKFEIDLAALSPDTLRRILAEMADAGINLPSAAQ